MARSIQGSPMVKKTFSFKEKDEDIKGSEESSPTAALQLDTSPLVKQQPLYQEFTSPRTIFAESASSLDSSLDLGSSGTAIDLSDSRRRSNRIRKSTLLATLVASNKENPKNEVPVSDTEIIK